MVVDEIERRPLHADLARVPVRSEDCFLNTAMATHTSPALPVISLAQLKDGSREEEASLRQALQQHGFFYLADHGIAQDLIDTVFHLQATFFAKSEDEKRIGIDRSLNLGWTPIAQERLDESRVSSAGDLKESFYVGQGIIAGQDSQPLPPSLDASRSHLSELWQESRRVVLELLDGFASVLGVERGFFTPDHTGGLDRLRLIHYPPAPLSATHAEDDEGDIRASQHSDYGSCTLLFQKDVGGLQVKLDNDQSPADVQNDAMQSRWIDVSPRPGCLVVNVADAMEFWTAGQLRSTVHRVRMPISESEAQSRYSIAFFCQPDEHTSLDPALLQAASRTDGGAQTSLSAAERRTRLVNLLKAKGIVLAAQDRPPTGGEYLQARLKATYA